MFIPLLQLQTQLKKTTEVVKNDTILANKVQALADAAKPENWKDISWDDVTSTIFSWLLHFSKNVIVAILLYYIGRFLIRWALRLLEKVLNHHDVEPSLASFVHSLVKFVLWFLLFITVISVLGLETSSFIAIFASASFALGMALSGTLQNFAGGVVLMITKPYRIGDYIIVNGQEGTVTKIQLFFTVLYTFDNQRICIPNGSLSNNCVCNYSKDRERRAKWTLSIAYGSDIAKAREVIINSLSSNYGDLLTRESNVFVESLSDGRITLTIRAWIMPESYWDVYLNMYEIFYTDLTKADIQFPYSQVDVHMKQQ